MSEQHLEQLDIPTVAELQPIIDFFKTMSDPTRMRIILALAKQPITVTEIAQKLNLSQSSVSHQLSLLKQQRFVTWQRAGKQIFYQLVDDHVLQIYYLTKSHIQEKNGLQRSH
ncbi:ArsR/SmtB family transcription factor [Bombilactobacillus bombi]|uniref:ArsR/SmtB family transcription factor n=1 Tax=Bombilactobacillus bombi TaxID=1303590 RepID=UPI0015E5E05E|nr:metalloregulator ArsR/SmtB family transcription factor [Bombilactobacillus bombi]MBA1434944.1 ArsR family transcriptional regulator [Bombilactobacillus bombi]